MDKMGGYELKAVIMAGGQGSRLRPLTCHLPKPMVPLLDRPCMEYIIELLRRHGITEIAVTLQYLPQVIKKYFGDGTEYGVHLHYFEETTPLGTAGSVKNAERFLDETFLVISGDGLTDFNLSEAISFHKHKQALGTLVLTKVEVPLEYGVVMIREDGKIYRFLEKPSWSEVFSDTVNTGIYILEPEILGLFRKEQQIDFSKDLFPLVLKEKKPLYGHVAKGYWSDIGTLAQYRQTQFDMLTGQVNIQIAGDMISPGVWFGKGVKVNPGTQIEGPVFIGDGTEVARSAKVGPFAVLGRYNRVEQQAWVEHSVVWSRAFVGKSAHLTGATVGSGAYIGHGSKVHEHAVVGEKTRIGDMAVIKPEVKIWPEKTVGADSVQQSSLIWGKSTGSKLFGSDGISGIANLDLTPEFVGKIVSAYCSCLPQGAKVSISCDNFPFSRILKYAAISGLMASGAVVSDIGITLAPLARFECARSDSQGGIHLRMAEPNITILQFFDAEGLPIDKGFERKIESALLIEDFARPGTLGLGRLNRISGIEKLYVEKLLSAVDMAKIRSRRFSIVVHCYNPQVMEVVLPILDRLGCQVVQELESSSNLTIRVLATQADIGIEFDSSGQEFQLYTTKGRGLSWEETLVLKIIASLHNRKSVAVPVSAPSVVEEMAENMGIPVIRTKTVTRSLLEVGKNNPIQVHHDGLYSLVTVLEHLALTESSLQRVLEEMPQFHMHAATVSCPLESKGRVMRRLMEELKGHRFELIDGIKVWNKDAWALIMPHSQKAQFRVVTQGSSHRSAKELTEIYTRKIASYLRG